MMTKGSSTEIRFDDMVVVVTGGARGMGLAHCQFLASRGAKLVLNDLGTATISGGKTSASVAQSGKSENSE
jgi:NAD(P)-dependent dehydrogenase (short-subunit alcohol dehydrogenase family)